jgi:hypothetical protein
MKENFTSYLTYFSCNENIFILKMPSGMFLKVVIFIVCLCVFECVCHFDNSMGWTKKGVTLRHFAKKILMYPLKLLMK